MLLILKMIRVSGGFHELVLPDAGRHRPDGHVFFGNRLALLSLPGMGLIIVGSARTARSSGQRFPQPLSGASIGCHVRR
ncbi:MAG: hypothetical protein MUW57_14100 [Pseudomonas sp.]|nr:hypothetical protein [Pseudomonas sp.]